MSNTLRELRLLLQNPPAELVSHFEGVAAAEVHPPLLSLAEAIATTEEFRAFHDLAAALGLVFLDDENTSNYHAYITTGPLAGNVLYLSHDGQTRVVFPSLADYMDAVRSAQVQNVGLYEFHPQVPVPAHNQSLLAERIDTLIEEDDEAELLVLIASWDGSHHSLLDKLIRHRNFFVAEAAGDAMANAPRPELLPYARVLSEHDHSQAANAGRRAVAAIQRSEKRNP